MPKRTGRRCAKNSHSIKKILRRNGGNVNCRKNKRQKAVHPGKEKSGNNTPAARRAAREARRNPDPDAMQTDDKAKREPVATAARREARMAIGKQLRSEELAKRRGLALQMGGGGLDDDVSVEEPDDDGPSASAVAGKALASAPSGQKAYQRELSKVLEASDVLVEVLDARDPMGCRCKALEDAVMQRWESKRVVLLLNKCDLVPPDVVQKWVAYLRQYFPTLPFKASTQAQVHGLGSSRGVLGGGSGGFGSGGTGASAYGADSLLQLLKNYSRSLNIKTAITVGIIGYPNVGKSSVINSLKRARAVNVGSTPGLTTHAQTVSLDKKVKLMDCPGIVFARAKNADEEADVLLRNCVRVERMADPLVPVAAILRRVPAAQLQALYGLEAFADAVEFATLVALKRGHLRKGGAADQEAAARAVLQDWNAGLIKYHTPPPQSASAVTIVSALAAEFDAAQQAAARVEQPGASQPPAAFQFAPVGSSGAAAGGGFGSAFGASAPPSQHRQAAQAASSMRVEGQDGDGDGGDGDDESDADGDSSMGGGAGGGAKGGLLVAARKQKLAPKLTRKEMAAAKQARKQDLRDEADQYNPQLNRAIAKKQKAQQRKQRRSSLSRLLAATAQ